MGGVSEVRLGCQNIGMFSIGQYHLYTLYIRYFLQGFHQIYGHIRRIYTVLANPRFVF